MMTNKKKCSKKKDNKDEKERPSEPTVTSQSSPTKQPLNIPFRRPRPLTATTDHKFSSSCQTWAREKTPLEQTKIFYGKARDEFIAAKNDIELRKKYNDATNVYLTLLKEADKVDIAEGILSEAMGHLNERACCTII